MREDVAALRAHLVAEVEQAKRESDRRQRIADGCADAGFVLGVFAASARTATDAWLAADARLRALDGLLAASKAQADERPWHDHSWPPTRAT